MRFLMLVVVIGAALVPQARPARDPAPHGGSLRFAVEPGGRYRMAITSRHWIDVISQGRAVDSTDHQGARDCDLVHKIVEFELPAHSPLVLQLSGSAEETVELTITPSKG